MDEKVLEERVKDRLLGAQTDEMVKAETIIDCNGDVQKAKDLLRKVKLSLSMNE